MALSSLRSKGLKLSYVRGFSGSHWSYTHFFASKLQISSNSAGNSIICASPARAFVAYPIAPPTAAPITANIATSDHEEPCSGAAACTAIGCMYVTGDCAPSTSWTYAGLPYACCDIVYAGAGAKNCCEPSARATNALPRTTERMISIRRLLEELE